MQVESEIAVQSHTFVGTAISSITHAIIGERVGLDRRRNLFLDKRKLGGLT
jgi:hypothetical protein